jgi:hypothetical protein
MTAPDGGSYSDYLTRMGMTIHDPDQLDAFMRGESHDPGRVSAPRGGFRPFDLPRVATFRIHAGPHEIYTEQAAQSLIGQNPRTVFRETEGGPVRAEFGRMEITAAKVVDGGRAMDITYRLDWPEEDPE